MKINVSIKAKTSLTVHAFADLLFILYFFSRNVYVLFSLCV